MKKITLLILMIVPFLAFGQNLAPNPTLNGSSDWSNLQPGTTQAYDAALTRTVDGSGSYLINSSGGFNSGIKSANISSLSAGEYAFSYYVYGTAGDKTKPIVRDNGTGTNIQGDVYTIQANNTWELAQSTFTISGTGTVNLRAMVNSSDTNMDFYVDDFSFTYIPPSGNTLTVNISGGGTVTKTLDKMSYADTDNETLTATPKLHWNFDSWSGDLTGSTNPASILMDADKTVTANFTLDQSFDYNFGFNTDNELEGWTVDPKVTVASHTGGLVTLSLTADQWSRFNLFDFPIPATTADPTKYNKVTIVVKNEEATTDKLGVTLGPNNNTKEYDLLSQPAFQTFEIDLTQFDDWTGDITSFRIRFADADNPTSGRPSVSHNVVIDSVVFSFDASLSSTDVSLNDFSMFPNPATDIVHFKSSDKLKSVSVYDVTGKTVVQSNSIVNNQIDVSHLRSGICIVKVESAEGNRGIKKLIIK